MDPCTAFTHFSDEAIKAAVFEITTTAGVKMEMLHMSYRASIISYQLARL